MEGNGTMRYSETFDPSIYRQLGFDELPGKCCGIREHSWKMGKLIPEWMPALSENGLSRSQIHKTADIILFFGMKKDGVTIEYSEGDIIWADVFRRSDYVLPERCCGPVGGETGRKRSMGFRGACQYSNRQLCENKGEVIGTSTFEEMAVRVESIKFCFIRDKQNDCLGDKTRLAYNRLGRLVFLV